MTDFEKWVFGGAFSALAFAWLFIFRGLIARNSEHAKRIAALEAKTAASPITPAEVKRIILDVSVQVFTPLYDCTTTLVGEFNHFRKLAAATLAIPETGAPVRPPRVPRALQDHDED